MGFHYISQVSTNSERKKLMETDYLSRYWRTQVCLNDGWSIWWCWGAALNAFDAVANHEKVRMVMNHDADANAQDKGTDAAAREVEAERSKILGHQRFNVRWEYLLSQLSTKINYIDIEERSQERILSWTRCCRCRWERWERRWNAKSFNKHDLDQDIHIYDRTTQLYWLYWL